MGIEMPTYFEQNCPGSVVIEDYYLLKISMNGNLFKKTNRIFLCDLYYRYPRYDFQEAKIDYQNNVLRIHVPRLECQ